MLKSFKSTRIQLLDRICVLKIILQMNCFIVEQKKWIVLGLRVWCIQIFDGCEAEFVEKNTALLGERKGNKGYNISARLLNISPTLDLFRRRRESVRQSSELATANRSNSSKQIQCHRNVQ